MAINNTFLPISSTPVLMNDNKVFSRPIFNFLSTLADNQVRTFQNFTPTGTADTAGKIGDSAFDDNYIYMRTSIGWRRVALSSF